MEFPTQRFTAPYVWPKLL